MLRDRSLSDPAHGKSTDAETAEQQGNGGDQRPQAQGIQPREGHVARSNHDRDDEVGPRSRDRDDQRNDHDHSVYRYEGVVDLRVHKVRPGCDQFGPQCHGEDATRREQNHRDNDVLHTDHLVVRRVLPIPSSAQVFAREVHLIVVVLVFADEPTAHTGKRTNT